MVIILSGGRRFSMQPRHPLLILPLQLRKAHRVGGFLGAAFVARGFDSGRGRLVHIPTEYTCIKVLNVEEGYVLVVSQRPKAEDDGCHGA